MPNAHFFQLVLVFSSYEMPAHYCVIDCYSFLIGVLLLQLRNLFVFRTALRLFSQTNGYCHHPVFSLHWAE